MYVIVVTAYDGTTSVVGTESGVSFRSQKNAEERAAAIEAEAQGECTAYVYLIERW